MSVLRLGAILLIVAGGLGLAFGTFRYNRETHRTIVGPMDISVTAQRAVNIPVWAGVGEPLSFAYQIVWHYSSESPRPPAGRVAATRVARTKVEGVRKFVIDFAGAQLDALPEDKPVEGVVTVGPGAKFLEQQVYKNRFTGGWRLVFQILPDEALWADRDRPKAKDPVELRAFLRLGDNVLTETWSYACEF